MNGKDTSRWRSRAARSTGIGAVALSALACYGTLAAVAILSTLGIALAVDEAAVGTLVALLAALAAIAVGAGARRYRSWLPFALAVLGAALVVVALFVAYDWRVELGGFVLLVVAAVWDFRLRRIGIDTTSGSHEPRGSIECSGVSLQGPPPRV